MTTLYLRKSIGRSPVRRGLPRKQQLARTQAVWIKRGFLPIALALALVVAWLALSPQARAVCQEGCDVTHANTLLGDDALIANTTGTDNTANGFQALFNNMTGSFNTANGDIALWSNTTGSVNTAEGSGALLYNTTGGGNTANGANALLSNTIGGNNTAIGFNALSKNTTASSNTATGHLALGNNNTGYRNTATGESALLNNIAGHGNTAIGWQTLYQNISGSNNIGVGFNAGSTAVAATFVSVTMFWELLARGTPPGSATFTPRSRLPGQFTSIPTTRSAPLSPRAGSRTRLSPWTRPAKPSWR
jgi:hypothetical protein